jgi:tetratricopeptide (TPR) repeat protein
MNPEDAESSVLAEGGLSPRKTSDRDTTLVLSLFGLVILFAVAGVTARFFHAKEQSLGREWYARGQADLQAGKPQVAIVDFRNALAYSRDNALYRLHLALALTAANRIEEARAHLLSLWERQPGDGTVNLELARLAARQGKVADAERYFHNAIFGVWPGNPDEARRDVRFELCDFLLAHGLKTEAQAALIELAANLPKDAELYARTGALFSQAGDYGRALDEFRAALAIDSGHLAALTGAGEAAFKMADYRTARHYLERAARLDPQNASTSHRLATVNQILSIDPLARGLSARERASRGVHAYEQAAARLEACAAKLKQVTGGAAPDTEIQAFSERVSALRPKVRWGTLARDPDLLTRTMDLVFAVEDATESKCGPASGLDLALLLLARQRGGAEP